MAMHPAPERSRTRRALLTALPVAVAVMWLLAGLSDLDVLDEFVLFWGLGSTVTTAVGALILWRWAGHSMGRLLVTSGLMATLSAVLGDVATIVDPSGVRSGWLTDALVFGSEFLSTASILVSSLFVVARFPSGRRTSRLGLLVELLGASVILSLVVAELVPTLASWLQEGGLIPALVAYPLAAIDVALRYRRAGSVERAQFRWLVAAASITGTLIVLMLVTGEALPWVWSAWIASTILPTIAVGFAVLRYRLYDIDRIVSRGIAYGAVTLVLFLVYFATNILLQNAISPLVDGNVIATAVSTLLVASLFQPVRRRIQRAVDRRFHRARHDADRLVDVFAGRLRESVDLPRLVGDLRQTAGEAVEPTAATVWLRGSRA